MDWRQEVVAICLQMIFLTVAVGSLLAMKGLFKMALRSAYWEEDKKTPAQALRNLVYCLIFILLSAFFAVTMLRELKILPTP